MITALCPTYNEEKYIHELLEFFCTAEPADKELVIIDGGSTDKTIEIVKKWQFLNKNIKLLHNPDKYVPYALNLGIRTTNGDPIIRLDAHTKYDTDYFKMVLKSFDTGADVVGGPMIKIGESIFQKAVAYATSTKFGIGDSKLHDSSFRGYTDHVYLGAWKRELFDYVGLFDERLKRNQDDEFHYRAKSMGKKIYLNPDIKSFYYPRSSLKRLFIQYFQYGQYKPLVLKKIKSEIKIRHIIPGSFLIYICSAPLWLNFPILTIPAIMYLILNVWFSFKNSYDYKIKLSALLVYPSVHLAYGMGTIYGLFKLYGKNIFRNDFGGTRTVK